MLCHLLLGKRFVTIRDEKSVPEDNDDVFLAKEESHSFEQQVAFVKTSRISVNSAKRSGSYVHVGVPGERRSLYSSTGWSPQASIAANGVKVGTQL